MTLETQYRCMGSNDYLLWLESVLGVSEEKRIFRKDGNLISESSLHLRR